MTILTINKYALGKIQNTSLVAQMVKTVPAMWGNLQYRFNPWVGKIPEGGNGNPLQYSCLENSLDRGAWQAKVHEVAKSRTQMTEWLTLSLSKHSKQSLETLFFTVHLTYSVKLEKIQWVTFIHIIQPNWLVST